MKSNVACKMHCLDGLRRLFWTVRHHGRICEGRVVVGVVGCFGRLNKQVSSEIVHVKLLLERCRDIFVSFYPAPHCGLFSTRSSTFVMTIPAGILAGRTPIR